MMRLVALIVTAVLAGADAAAQEGQPSLRQDSTTPPAGNPTTLDLPVSVDKIRDALQVPPTEPLRGLDEKPLFRIEIREKQRFDELLANLGLGKEPVPRGGLYAFEQHQSLWSPQLHPEMQPYAAFNQGQLIVILLEEILQRSLARHIAGEGGPTNAELAARDEVQQALGDFWTYQAQLSNRSGP